MLTGTYKDFYEKISKEIPASRIMSDPLCTLAFGTDASFYRLIPKIVIRAYGLNEVKFIIKTAFLEGVPITFRSAGTSLSGQGITDSVLVITSHGFEDYEILDEGRKIKLRPGIRGGKANRILKKYGRKIGPDPASIESAMIGGIVANNASGMSCGISWNSYRTIDDMELILSDGTLLDTSSEVSRRMFRTTHGELLRKLDSIADEIRNNPDLKKRIEKKYSIKNTTGYGLNSFIDYTDGFDILKHLIVGSEGTLAFISEVTFNTVEDLPVKSLACAIYKNIEDACTAVEILQKQPVSAVELIDRSNLKLLENLPGIPSFLKNVPLDACGLLIETSGKEKNEVRKQAAQIKASIDAIEPAMPYEFTEDPAMQGILWKIRQDTFPAIAGQRESGTTALIEDICFPPEQLAEAVGDLHRIFVNDGYENAVIYGHALAGNLHFVFNQDFGNHESLQKYEKFMNDITEMVVGKYDGSLKAEHGTGRNMAPFVELEWGKRPYEIMQEIKEAFDPRKIMNPGVILNKNRKIHLENLKPCFPISETADKCMECGFCERSCVSEGLTLSPRQRIAVHREIKRLEAEGKTPHILGELKRRYEYWGKNTCATDSLCMLGCPVHADAGKLIKELRSTGHTESQKERAMKMAENMDKVTSWMRIMLNVIYFLRLLLGKEIFGTMARAFRKAVGPKVPMWNEYMPKGSRRFDFSHVEKTGEEELPGDENHVVYFPSCITRTMGKSKSHSKEVELSEATESILKKAGYKIIYPENSDKLCCGMAFTSKGFVEAGMKASDTLKKALYKASGNGKYPIVCDMSSCLYTMKSNMEGELRLYDTAEFIYKFILDRLDIKKVPEKVAVFGVCASKHMGTENYLYGIAERCAEKVVVLDANCCGFAGDRGFTVPELNEHGLRDIKRQTDGYEPDGGKSAPCSEGFATNRTCEIGLSRASGIDFRSIIYLVNRAGSPKKE